MTAQEAPAGQLKCRYRYATGCTAEYGSKPGMYAHEKTSPAHAAHRVTLRDCPECGLRCGDEVKRANHLSAEHGVSAASERRREMDARQVKELYDVLQAESAPAASANGTSGTVVFEPDGHPDLGPWANGHSPAPVDLSATMGTFTAMAAELTALRAENAQLRESAATLAQIRGLLAED